VEARVFRGEARNGGQGRIHRLERDGRSQRFHSHAAAGDLPADVRQLRACHGRDEHHVHVAGRAFRRAAAAAGSPKNNRARAPLPEDRQEGHGAQQRDAENRSGPGNLRSARRWGARHLRARAHSSPRPALFFVLGAFWYWVSLDFFQVDAFSLQEQIQHL
jgi:hypothetical protein